MISRRQVLALPVVALLSGSALAKDRKSILPEPDPLITFGMKVIHQNAPVEMPLRSEPDKFTHIVGSTIYEWNRMLPPGVRPLAGPKLYVGNNMINSEPFVEQRAGSLLLTGYYMRPAGNDFSITLGVRRLHHGVWGNAVMPNGYVVRLSEAGTRWAGIDFLSILSMTYPLL